MINFAVLKNIVCFFQNIRFSRFCVVLILAILLDESSTQTLPVSPIPIAAHQTVKNSKEISDGKSTWAELTVVQRQALMPLADQWSNLTNAQRRKWLALSQNYATMANADRAKLQARMTEWVQLTPQQRSQARLNFGSVKQLTPEEKQAKWQAYQALSPAEKRKLAAATTINPAGAAPAVKPTPVTRLAIPSKPVSASLSQPHLQLPIPEKQKINLMPESVSN